MTLRGKDYCNCEHARMFRGHIEAALKALGRQDLWMCQEELSKALEADLAAYRAYEADELSAGENAAYDAERRGEP